MATALDDSWDDHQLATDDPDGVQPADILLAFGYQPESTTVTDVFTTGLCARCDKKVYPVEAVDVGVVYHRGCFKCRVCKLQLTLKTFQLEADDRANKDVYCNVHVPRLAGGGLGSDAMGIRGAMDVQKRQSEWIRRSALEPGHGYEPNYLGYENSPWRQEKQRKSQKKPTTLASFEEFEKHGVFDAQAALEQCHREEEDALYREIFEARDGDVRELERRIAAEKQRTVRDLISWFEKIGWSQTKREAGMKQVETYFKNYKLQKMQDLLRRLAAEEEAAAARMIEKHSQEMLMLISGKEQEFQDNMSNERFDDEVTAIIKGTDLSATGDDGDDVINNDEDDIIRAGYVTIQDEGMEDSDVIARLRTITHDDTPIGRHNQAFSESHEEINFATGVSETVLQPSTHYGGENAAYEPDSPLKKSTLAEASEPEVTDQHSPPEPSGISVDASQRSPEESSEQPSDVVRQKPSDTERTTPENEYTESNDETVVLYAHRDDTCTISVTSRPRHNERLTTPQRDSFESVTGKAADIRPKDFNKLDTLAIKEASKEHNTFTDLVRKLSRRCTTQLQKVRAIFRWITVKDLNRINVEHQVDNDTPMGLLRGIKLGTESYHTLFKRLCSYVGLRCEIIGGYSKGAGYRPGSGLNRDAFRNQWTAVMVDGTWRFINCNWGARHVRRSGASDELVYTCDEFYFLTDPEDHIYQHFPDDPHWQLLRKPITLDDFVRLPVIKSPFFSNYLAFAERYQSTIHTEDGFVNIRILAPELNTMDVKLKSRHNRVSSDVLKERIMIRRIDAEVIFTVCLPDVGQYIMEIFVDSHWREQTMDIAASFRLVCESANQGLSRFSYPPVPCFGRQPAWAELGLVELTHADPYIEHNEEVMISVSAPVEVQVGHTLERWKTREKAFKDFSRAALLTCHDEHAATYLVRCPERGLYVLKLYACATDGAELECVYNFLIHCRCPVSQPLVMPTTSRRWKHCRLVAPLAGDLPTNTGVDFVLQSTKAVVFAVALNGRHWKKLQETEDNMWCGTIQTGDQVGKLAVYGQFDMLRRKYIPLLEYNLFDV